MKNPRAAQSSNDGELQKTEERQARRKIKTNILLLTLWVIFILKLITILA